MGAEKGRVTSRVYANEIWWGEPGSEEVRLRGGDQIFKYL